MSFSLPSMPMQIDCGDQCSSRWSPRPDYGFGLFRGPLMLFQNAGPARAHQRRLWEFQKEGRLLHPFHRVLRSGGLRDDRRGPVVVTGCMQEAS